MKNNNYNYKCYKDTSNLILRDYLAIDRTILANERTLLAYVRTFLALLIAGTSIIHFLDNIYLKYIGVFSIVISLIVIIIGIKNFIYFKIKLNSIETK